MREIEREIERERERERERETRWTGFGNVESQIVIEILELLAVPSKRNVVWPEEVPQLYIYQVAASLHFLISKLIDPRRLPSA
jgi:hypothetical protein